MLAQLALELQGQSCFLQLPSDGSVLAEENRSRQLLGDCAGALAYGALTHVGHDGPSDSPAIHTVMLVKASVFCSDEGLLHQQGHLPGFQFLPGGRAQLLNHLAVGGEQGDRSRSVEAGNSAGIWQGCIHQLG